MNYYEHHLGDYLRDTAHLSMIEDGAYRRLLDQYFIREAPLPADKRQCMKLARAHSAPERAAVSTLLDEFFELRDDGYHQSRADAEIARFQEKKRKAKASADARWSQSERNANASQNAMRTHTEGICVPHALQTPDSRLQTPEQRNYTHSVRVPRETESEIWQRIERLKAIYPKPARADWITGEKLAREIVLRGEATWQQLEDGVQRYAALCLATDRMPLNPANYFGAIDKPWSQEWALPAPKINGSAAGARRSKTADELEAEAAARGEHAHG